LAEEPTIEEMLRPVPKQMDALEIAPTSRSIVAVKEWLDDIELIRGRSSYQGVLSKRIKERVASVKKVLDILAIRVEGKGDVEYQKRRNAELQAQLLASQREMTRMSRRIDELQRTLNEVRRYMVTDGQMPKSDKATSPLENMKEEPRRAEQYSAAEEDEVVMRPPIKGVSTPIPSRRNKDNFKNEDAEISRQIVELVAKRKQLRKERANSGNERSADPSPMDNRAQPNKALPKIISNIQVKPPREQPTQSGAELRGNTPQERTTKAMNEWQVVKSKSAKKKEEKASAKSKTGNTKDNTTKKSNEVPGTKTSQKRRRPPRTAAVAIKGITEGFSYASALRSLRDKIVLPELKIEGSHIRKAANGGIIIEIPGEDRSAKADKLKEKIAEVLGDTARVSRPKIRGEIRLIGFDDSVVSDEIADVIAMTGGCRSDEVKVGLIRPMANGLYTAWVGCPIGAAIKASASSKIKIGWTVAKIELLKSRPIQCYRCWGKGHLRAQCRADIDLSKTCYRCGTEGHPAAECKNEVACALCKLQGRSSEHRVGSTLCGADFTLKGKRDQSRKGLIPMEVEEPARRAVDEESSNDE